ncbi:DNA recombination protein RmuC [Patescibacteria group bacterium]|nr:DNA recombination protein RmuC [Patescibacteria group bacterium]
MFILIAGGMMAVAFFLTRKKGDIDQKQNDSIRDLERRLTDLMSGQLKEIRGSVDGTSKAMNQQISSFTKETVQIREDMKQVQEVMKSISSFQEIFRSPKLRGEWGEESLEHILSEYFPKELYQSQYLFSSGEQVDIALKLPNNKILPIDAKFSYDNYKKMVEAENDEEKKLFRKKFIEDTKVKIQEIASKYILPSEGTTDQAIMYIPAEAVYYEITMMQEEDLARFARSKRIILASPNNILLTLSAVSHWYKDVQISRKTQDILKRLTKIQQNGKKIMDVFRKLGSHLKNALSSYDDSEKLLSRFDDRVERLLEGSSEEKQLPSGSDDD